MRPATKQRRRLVTNETAATGGVIHTDEGELEFDEDEMAVLEGQRLVAEFRCRNLLDALGGLDNLPS